MPREPRETHDSDEKQETEELINESQEITLEPVIMDEQHDSSEVPDEHVRKKEVLNTENQKIEQLNDKPNSLSRELEIAENQHQSEEQKTSEILFGETDNTRTESRPTISETIDSFETLNEKLEQHHDLKEIAGFAEHYRRATIYFQVKDLHKQNALESLPYKTLEKLSKETGIHTWTLRRWERNTTQPWLLHRITQREMSEIGKIEQTWHITSFEDFQSLLNRHPHLEERPTFTEQYHRVQQYYKFHNLRQHGHLNDYPSISALARKLGASRDSVDLWRQNKSRPQLINVVLRHELTRIKYEANLHLEAFYHRIPPEQAYNAFKHLRHHKHPTPQDLATAIDRLRLSTNLTSPLHFFKLSSYHEYGPKWLRNIATAIEHNQNVIEHIINQQAKPNETTRIGVTNNHVYLWKRDTSPNNWLNIYHHEHFYFASQEEKNKLIDHTRKHLALSSDIAISKLIGQLTDYRHKIYTHDSISSLRRNEIIMEGETLHFILSAIDKTEHHIQPLLSHIGTGNLGTGRILNPKFPPIEPLRTQLYATMISDGHLTKDFHLDYVEKREGRLNRVRALLSEFGDVEYKEYIKPGGTTHLSAPAVIGKFLEQCGFPIGDKAIVNPEIPEYIQNGIQEIKSEYLRQLIPEDGTFTIDKRDNRGEFRFNRTIVLDAGNKNIEYQFIPRTSEHDKHFIQQFGNTYKRVITRNYPFEMCELKWAKLRELTKSTEPSTGRAARSLEMHIRQTPCHLLDGEIQLCTDLGIKMRKSTVAIYYFLDSGRVSVERSASTRGKEDAIRWALIAPPNDRTKRRRVSKWLNEQFLYDVEPIRKELKRKSLNK